MSLRLANVHKLILVAAVFMAFALPVHAQESLSMTVTPPLYQLSVAPGETFTTVLSVVNSNTFPLTVYIEPVIFTARGEAGQGVFEYLGRDSEVARHTLAGWITIPRGPHTIHGGQTKTVPLIITTPEDAPPGGHYAALVVSNEPPRLGEGSLVSIASAIASLVFLRVSGDVIEQGIIREFSTERTIYQHPEAKFTLRFQNTGNTHVLPRGHITIYNIWGRERGVVPINESTHFGNVLPNSVRSFSFVWKSEESLFDFGRYRAVATLTFGELARQNVTREAYFWVVPLKGIALFVGGSALLLALFFMLVRWYVRYALALEARRLEVLRSHELGTVPASPLLVTMLRPLRSPAVDLRRAASLAPLSTSGSREVFVWRMGWVVLFFAAVFSLWYLVRLYTDSVFTYERQYQIEFLPIPSGLSTENVVVP